MSDLVRISVVVPTWNRAELVRECLRSVLAQTYPATEIIVVDDGSTDGTADMLAAEFPDAHVVRREKNEGFARAVNTGLYAANGDWILILNNDVTLASDFLQQMLHAAENSGADMVSPLILWKEEPEVIYSAGDGFAPGFRPVALGFREKRETFRLPSQIWGVGGTAGLFRSELFSRVGFLDETFRAYFEDADFCFRARLSGASAVLAPNAVAYHIGSASLGGSTWWRSKQCYINHALLIAKNVPISIVWSQRRKILRERRHQAAMCFTSARAEFGAVKALLILLEAITEVTWKLAIAMFRRRAIQRSRKLSVVELEDALRGLGRGCD